MRANRQRVSGPVPYGFRLAADGVRLLESPAEQRGIQLIQRPSRQVSTTRQIGRELERRGLRHRSGWHWHLKVIMDVSWREGSPDLVK